jgi:SAM-dependent methyltransferase
MSINQRNMISTVELQKTEFLSGEGNQWFQRNRLALSSPSPMRSLLVERLAGHMNPNQGRVLEVGCANGANLWALHQKLAVEVHGIDPSEAAVQDGLQTYPGLSLKVGAADQLTYDDGYFDAVVFGFCLYLIDRTLLMRCASEADRVLRDGGVLVILDFDPPLPCVRDYVHRPGLKSFKMDHSALFLGNPAYVLAEKHAMSHEGLRWHSDPNERVGLWLLRKDLANAYSSN